MKTILYEILKAFIVGFFLGGVCSFLKIPVPAPSKIAGVIAIAGLFFGWKLIDLFFRLNGRM